MREPLLEVEDLHVAFDLHAAGRIEAVRGVSFSVPRGRTVALVGESGSGKSVIAQSIMGILPASARIERGALRFHDPLTPGQCIDIARLDPNGAQARSLRGARISIIFQEPMTSLSPLHTIADQVGEAVRLHQGVNRREARQRAQLALEQVGFPQPARALDRYPFELSGGLRQRAMIAMALVCRPALLVADEPTTALDVTIQAQIIELLARLQGELDMAVLLITHDLGVVANMADEVVVVYNGQRMESGSASDLFEQPKHPYLKALMHAVPRIGMPREQRLSPLRAIEITRSGHLAQAPQWPDGADEVGPLLRVERISKRYKVRKGGLFASSPASGTLALDNVTLEVRRGECLGLVGESGCGKTTLSKVIMRAVTPDSGRVLFNDGHRLVDIPHLNGEQLLAFRRQVQLVFQDPFGSLNPRMTVLDLVAEPLLIHGMGDRTERIEIVKQLMAMVGLDPRFLARYPHSFSGGQRQRIGLARALALGPRLLVCDEPVSALDVSVQAQVLNLFKDLKQELGLTYLFVSHNLAVVDYMADRIAVMCAGQLVEVAPREVLFAEPIHPYTRALLAAVPRADPRVRLDLSALMQGRASIPHEWPAPFRTTESRPGVLNEVAPGHQVRMSVGEEEEAAP